MLKDKNVIYGQYQNDLIALEKLSKEERDSIPDEYFGLQKERKYPLDTMERIKDAIAFFHFCKGDDKRKELAHNIAERIKELTPYSKKKISIKSTSQIFRYLSEEDKNGLDIIDVVEKTKADKDKEATESYRLQQIYFGDKVDNSDLLESEK